PRRRDPRRAGVHRRRHRLRWRRAPSGCAANLDPPTCGRARGVLVHACHAATEPARPSPDTRTRPAALRVRQPRGRARALRDDPPRHAGRASMTEQVPFDAPRSDVIAEAHRLLAAARRARITIRLLGGVAIALLARDQIPEALRRGYADIDLATRREDAPRLRAMLGGCGYVANRRVHPPHGAQRPRYY